jgi:hypothetical protein
MFSIQNVIGIVKRYYAIYGSLRLRDFQHIFPDIKTTFDNLTENYITIHISYKYKMTNKLND